MIGSNLSFIKACLIIPGKSEPGACYCDCLIVP